ncbi:uncharacterized protein LOC115442830 [Manduca sexta]|uniref:Uncharacterized protein n=1 Tax=Manduca sexta TaxID=7130 RepID=A0A921YKN9_MANSE|nr:uncharacterized protein LOC115442830 [Manduca sexta]KAG6440941.1 hypothetical protein O3G_MSEX001619 [Manduca sexta]
MRKAGKKVDQTQSKLDRPKGSRAELASRSEQNVKIMKNVESTEGPGQKISPRVRRNMERVEMLARPNARRLRSLWDEKCAILPPDRRDKIKSALEEDYFLSPEQTEQYFQALQESSKRWSGPGGMMSRKDQTDKAREYRQRQKWLVNFSAQVAYKLCDYIAKGQKEMLVSNRLRSIADVVLEKVAEILGEPKPSRTHPGRLARFMVAISDRIAVWIENAVYRADAIEPFEVGSVDEHMRLDAEKPLIS